MFESGKLVKIDAKCGSNFNLSDSKRFNSLKSNNFEDGAKAIICTGQSVNSLSDGTLLVPFKAI